MPITALPATVDTTAVAVDINPRNGCRAIGTSFASTASTTSIGSMASTASRALTGAIASITAIGTFSLICLSLSASDAAATTLVKCRINKKTVYSDTDCPNKKDADSHSAFGPMPVSKPIKIKTTRAKKAK